MGLCGNAVSLLLQRGSGRSLNCNKSPENATSGRKWPLVLVSRFNLVVEPLDDTGRALRFCRTPVDKHWYIHTTTHCQPATLSSELFSYWIYVSHSPIINHKKAVLSRRWPCDASCFSHVSSQSRTRVKLNTVFFVRFLVSPKFLDVPLGVDGRHLGYEEQRCWANCT